MSRLAVFLTLVLLLVVGSYFGMGGGVGAETVIAETGRSTSVFFASASLSGLVVAIVLAGFILLFPRKRGTVITEQTVGLLRRLAAFYLDFFLFMLVLAPLLATPALLIEASATGEFEWEFVRDFSRPSDGWVLTPVFLFAFYLLYSYFYWHAAKQRQTIGKYLLGYSLRAADETGDRPQFGRGLLLGALGMAVWPISLVLALRHEDKALWWDVRTNVQAVMVVHDRP